MAKILAEIFLILFCCFLGTDAQADTAKSNKDYLVATGLTNGAVGAIKDTLQQNKIPFTTEGVVGEGERFEVTGEKVATQAFGLLKALKHKFSKEELVIPDKLIGRTLLDYCAIGMTYDIKADELIDKYCTARGLPSVLLNGDTMAGYQLECKKESGVTSIATLRDFAKVHPEIHIQIFDQPYPIYQYDEPVPSVNVKM